MAYCTAAQIRGTSANSWRDGMLIGVSNTVLSDDTVVLHITRAENIINHALSKRYTVPFTAVPPLVTTLAIDVASYFIMRSLYTKDSQNKNDWVDDLLKTAKEELEDLANGKRSLLDSNGAAIAQLEVNNISANRQSYTPVFDMDAVENQNVDNNLMADIAVERD